MLISIAGARKLAETLEKNGSSLVGIQQNLVDSVWGKDRPPRPSEKVRVHPNKYAGKSFQDKVADLRKELETKKKGAFFICRENRFLFSHRKLLTGDSHAR
jgi:Xaa-Pro aminopeptidase